MEKIVLNQYQLADQDVEYSVDRVKALIVNNSNQIVLCKVNGCFSFVGGHVEGGESLEECLKREVLEETGCVIEITENLGITEEIKSHINFKQISNVFVGKVIK
jgi:nucleoside triphosphatase